ncbi:TonB-dependent siderophore receptor [Rhodobacter capsulatus]|uniref:TonB-dependent siderophore receptor n=1 Tax=Rhodobacter capsulatus TaxID=1061 RepID=A0A4U1JZY5_RHOCA|nr:TonB-dependent siderophore receptor [Rhodobacter capsulatus]TKD25139.1 TonB-dependent siderophore receptor [Rhodobacter capsulatus]
MPRSLSLSRFSPLLAALICSTVLSATALRAEDTTDLQQIDVSGGAVDETSIGYVAQGSHAGTKTAAPLTKTAQAISVVPASQIADQGATSVAQALRYTPGIVTEYRGSSNLHDETFVRGFYYVPRFLDGLAFGTNSFGQIDPALLERVELVKGPSSVLYGQANPGGLIAMTTKKADGAHHGEMVASFGTGDRAGLSFDLGDRLSDTLSWRLAGTGWRVDTQENGLEQQRFSFAPSLTWAPTDATRLTVLALVQNEPDAGFRNFREAAGTLIPTATGDLVPWDFLVSDPAWDRSTRNTRALGAEFEHDLTANTTLRAKARLSQIDSAYRTLIWGALASDGVTISRSASGGTDDLRQGLLDLSLEHRFHTGAVEHRLLAGIDHQDSHRDYHWGYDFSTASIDWTNPVYGQSDFDLSDRVSDTDTDARQTGLYLQDQATVGNWTLSAGLRLDDFRSEITDNQTGTTSVFDDRATTGRIAALYSFDNGIAPYISWSSSFEPVTQSSGTAVPFDPTEAEQLEIGAKWASADGRLFAQAAVYDLSQTGVLVYNDSSSAYEQIGRIDSRGLELEGRAELGSGWSVIAAAGWIDAEVKETTTAAELGKTPARVPDMTASIWAKYTAEAGYDVALGLRHIGASQGNATNTFEVPSVTLVDLALGYDLGRLTPAAEGVRAQLNVQNLTDRQYVASCASAYACFVGSERRVTASVSTKF